MKNISLLMYFFPIQKIEYKYKNLSVLVPVILVGSKLGFIYNGVPEIKS